MTNDTHFDWLSVWARLKCKSAKCRIPDALNAKETCKSESNCSVIY